jgi:hypothetical protein
MTKEMRNAIVAHVETAERAIYEARALVAEDDDVLKDTDNAIAYGRLDSAHDLLDRLRGHIKYIIAKP